MDLTGWVSPVYDRKKEDVQRAAMIIDLSWTDLTLEQRAEYESGLKGCMNQSDFERIQNNIRILLSGLGIDWAVEKVPDYLTKEYLEDMQDKIKCVREGYPIHIDTPQVPELPLNTWRKFNDIEKILADVYEIITAQFKYYAGHEIYTGESIGLLL